MQTEDKKLATSNKTKINIHQIDSYRPSDLTFDKYFN